MSIEQMKSPFPEPKGQPWARIIAIPFGVISVISMLYIAQALTGDSCGNCGYILGPIALFITLPTTVIALLLWGLSSAKGFWQVIKFIGFVAVAVFVVSIVVSVYFEARDWVTSAFAGTSDSDKIGGYVDTINYNYNRTYGFSLYDLTAESDAPISGGVVWQLASGGNVNCCIALPKQWRPGLKVRLDWRESDHTWSREGDTFDIHRELIGEHAEEFEIPHYDQPGNLFIVFLPEGKVELVVSKVEPASPDWPGSIKQTPWDYCVEKNGRFPCKMVLPPVGLTITELRGLCRRQDKETCDKAMGWCFHDYEDKALCERVLWSKEEKR
jgi:hypothetical protein